MGGWRSMEEAELEEGEAACYSNKYGVDDDKRIDPLAYIGEKLQNVLGHFRKDFAGGVSAENLGAKFGDYGSFLPMYQLPPPTCSHPKTTPPRVQNHNTSRSPGNFLIKGGLQNCTAPLDVPLSQTRQTSASRNTDLLHKSKSSSRDGSIKQEPCLVAEKISGKHGPFSKSVNPPEQKKITVRIKVGSDNEAQKNAALYSGLGLTSPSSSTGNSPEESYGTPVSSQAIPSDSSAGILQILTSFPVAGELLLSPLHENLLNLIRSGKELLDAKPARSLHGKLNNSVSMLRNEELWEGKSSKKIRTGEIAEQPKYEDQMHSVDNNNSVSETLESRQSFNHDWSNKALSDAVVDIGHSIKGDARVPESVRHPEKNMPVKKRDINKDRVKNRPPASDFSKHETLKSLHTQDAGKHEHQDFTSSSIEKFGGHQVKNSQKGPPIDHKGDSRSKGKIILASLKDDSDVYEGKLDSLKPIVHLNYKGMKASSHESKKNASKKLSSEGKKKMKRSQTNGKLTSDLADASLKSGVRAVKDKMSALKDVNKVRNSYKDLFDTRLDHVDSHANLALRPSVDNSKESGREIIAGKGGSVDKNKESSGLQKFNNQLSIKDPLTSNVPSASGLMSGVEPERVAPVLIEEHWVCCDRCETWRLLPPGTLPEHLPEKWLCSMLNWLSGMNRCDISEDETTRAVQAKYHAPLPEIQNNLQNNADSRHFDQIHQNVGSQYMSSEGKKTFKTKETILTSNSSGPIMNLHLMKNPQEDVLRSKSVKNRNQPAVEANIINKSDVKHLKKLYKAVEKHPNNREENDRTKGDGNPRKKIKRERESDLYEQGSVKKPKTEVELGKNNFISSEYDGNLGRISVISSTGLPTKAALKDTQKQIDQRESEKLKISVKKRRDSSQGSLDRGCADVETDGRGISTKKRKLMDGQDYLEKLQSNGNHFRDMKVSVKEDSSDSGVRSLKKFKLLGSEGKGSIQTKADDKLKRGETTMPLISNRAGLADEDVKKAQQLGAKMRSGLTLDDIESLKKDLGSEQLSTAANSSSSKVSDSRRSRANYQDVKGSPVESVSSSPMRTSNMNKHSPARTRGYEKDDCKFGDPMVGSRGRSLYGDDIFEKNQSGTTMRERVSSVSHRESFETPVLESRENHIRGKGVTALSNSADVHLGNTGSEASGRLGTTAHQSSKARMSKNRNDDFLHQKKSGKISSARSNGNEKASAFSVERLAAKVSDLASDQDILHSKKFVRDDPGIEQNHRAEIANKSISNQVEARNRKLQVCLQDGNKNTNFPSGGKLATESQRGKPSNVQPLNASAGGEGLKVLKTAGNAVHQNGTHGSMSHPASDQCGVQDLSGPSHTLKEAPTQSASSALLKEAETRRDCADRLKDSGFVSECNEAYFQAALMFLHGASLLESTESNKHGEMNQMQIYSTTAKLCETCALEYEKRQEMAAAALAYKCMEVAHMRVVYCKNPSTNRIWHDLQASLQMISQNESPSSSASDIDNLNNQIAAEKAALSKGNGSLAGNHIIAPRNRPNFVRLLDFTKDVNSAMEAFKKSQSAFAAASTVISEQAQNKDIIISVKRAIDFSFQDVEELVRMVRHAIGAIGRLRGG